MAEAASGPMCGWWMPPGTCPPTSATPRPNSRPAHIPGAVFFDIDALSDRTFAPAPYAAAAGRNSPRDAGALGLGDGDMIVVYDGTGIYSAPRVWWMLQGHGPRQGRGAGWRTAGMEGGGRRAGERSAPAPSPRHFTRPSRQAPSCATSPRSRRRLGNSQILDARSAPRFEGQ